MNKVKNIPRGFLKSALTDIGTHMSIYTLANSYTHTTYTHEGKRKMIIFKEMSLEVEERRGHAKDFCDTQVRGDNHRDSRGGGASARRYKPGKMSFGSEPAGVTKRCDVGGAVGT